MKNSNHWGKWPFFGRVSYGYCKDGDVMAGLGRLEARNLAQIGVTRSNYINKKARWYIVPSNKTKIRQNMYQEAKNHP